LTPQRNEKTSPVVQGNRPTSNTGRGWDWELWSGNRSVVYRIRILESNPAGYLDFFGFGLDWISFPFQPDPDYANEI